MTHCDPILEMAISQDDLRAMYERLESNRAKTKSCFSGQPSSGVPKPPLVGMHKIYQPYAEITAAKNVAYPIYGNGEVVPVKKPVRSKYGNEKQMYDGVKFDSKHELECWKNLKLREKAGEISDLERQVKFDLVVKDKKIGRFTADFRWWEGISCVVADAKSEITRKETSYRLRKKIFEAQYAPLVIREL